ncbi:hypothetical protein N7497_009081 [Penicillium chrysogenum]|uniref:Uncharacterized protein n=1 Tax=Penicillium chrysogenum TaxID=5076 RepID=A0ABQ8WJG0_PENCH|nr:hypothetical protein N7524_008002 [Penicillium chrysogenum]KAJ5270159.1 hypothetical protein N7505_005917 [Penicillium chrysogenum]KAJ6147099.1 hypothetical protein N7497_009081 [Penicillium chrysogenum]
MPNSDLYSDLSRRYEESEAQREALRSDRCRCIPFMFVVVAIAIFPLRADECILIMLYFVIMLLIPLAQFVAQSRDLRS